MNHSAEIAQERNVNSKPINLLDYARYYAINNKWRIIPIKPKGKIPALKNWPSLRLTEDDLPKHFNGKGNIAVLCGEDSGIVILDVDYHDELNDGKKTLETIMAEKGITGKIETLKAKTGGGGYHLFFTYPKGLQLPASLKLGAGLELLGNKHLAMLEPSVTKGEYKWLVPLETPIADLPDWLLEEVENKLSKKTAETEPEKIEKETSRESSQAKIMVDITLTKANELFYDKEDNPYCIVGDRVFQIDSTPFRDFLRNAYIDEKEKIPNRESIRTAIDVLSGYARTSNNKKEVFIRLGKDEEGNIYHDLGNVRVVKISKNGWEGISPSPVIFRQDKSILPLPLPSEEDNSLDIIKEFINTKNEEDFILFIAWLIGCFNINAPCVTLSLSGEQGSGKSTTQRVIKSIIDPNIASSCNFPKDEESLFIKTRNNWILSFDNVSHLGRDLADSFCRIATEGSISNRKRYTDLEEVTITARRPIIINGINNLVADKSDLLDRSIIINLEPIPEELRKDEKDFWETFNNKLPYILGALYDALACGLRNYDKIKLSRKPRMLDFTKWVYACGDGIGSDFSEKFLNIYCKNIKNASALAIEGDPVAESIKKLLNNKEDNKFVGTGTELLKELKETFDDKDIPSKFPNNAVALGRYLIRIAPNLRNIGVFYEPAEKTIRKDGCPIREVKLYI